MANRSILVVEDDQLEIMTLQRAMRDIGCTWPVIVARNGEQGLEILSTVESHNIRFILIDLNMPRMNGLEFLKHIKDDPRTRALPAVVLTTSDQPEERRVCYELGSAGYFVKSSTYPDFVEMLKVICAYWNASGLSA